MDYPVISLFSGAMGLDLGLQRAGMRIAVTQEIDPWCTRTILNNGHKCVTGDISSLIEHDQSCSFVLQPAGLRPGEAFAVVGGPPCQPFSTAGKRRGITDPRGRLFRDFVHVIDKTRPRFFVMENVKGLLSASLSPDNKRGKACQETEPGSVFDVILSEFHRIGYSTVHGLLDAVHYGVPQFRERLVIIGSRDCEDIFLPVPTHFQRHQSDLHRWATLGQAIRDLEGDQDRCARFSDERMRYLRFVPPGGNWRNLPVDVLESAMGGAYLSGGGKVGFFRRLDYAQPSPTLVTSPTHKATMLCHPSQDRPLSVREYMRIQQFPDDWKVAGSLADSYRQIGNAVPVGLGFAIGQALLATANGTDAVRVKRTRGTSVHRKLGMLSAGGSCS